MKNLYFKLIITYWLVGVASLVSSGQVDSSNQSISSLAPTPPMGWNSWDSYGMDITEDQLKAVTDYMSENLSELGWEYIVLDMGWNYGEGVGTLNFLDVQDPAQYIDEYGRLIPNPNKFPSSRNGMGLKPLADYVHSKGLKFGIHIMRGIPWQAVDKDLPIKGTNFTARDIASEKDSCMWFDGLKTIDTSKSGAQEYYNSLVELYAEWGVDFVKADDMIHRMYREGEISALANAIQNNPRPIVLSLSAGPTLTGRIEDLRQSANMWRISGDMWDRWHYVVKAFELCREWQDFVTPGHWPDCDMLPFGKLCLNGTNKRLSKRLKLTEEERVNRNSLFTSDEEITVMTLWSIFRSPLMMGGDLLQLDEETNELLTNREVIGVNQKTTNNRELRFSDDEVIWIADEIDSEVKYLALFNLRDEGNASIAVDWEELGLSGKYKARDLWNKEELGRCKDRISLVVAPHGARLIKLYK